MANSIEMEEYVAYGLKVMSRDHDVRDGLGVPEYREASDDFVAQFNACQIKRTYSNEPKVGYTAAYPNGYDSGGSWFTVLFYKELGE